MKKLRFAILDGLARVEGQKPVVEVLDEDHLQRYTKKQLATAIKHLEILGLIRLITPAALTAELTPFGRELLQSI
jgi:hypothetical protein